MSTRFISADRNQPLLLSPDLREWVPDDDLVHFAIEAVDTLDTGVFKVGRVSLDGTTLKASANKNGNVRYDRGGWWSNWSWRSAN